MAGFGSESFGEYLFGETDWAKRAMFGSIPALHRQKDTDGLLEELFETFQEELDRLRFLIRDLPLQRDPLSVIASNVNQTVLVESAETIIDDFWGQSVLFKIQIGQDASDIGPGWFTTIDDKVFNVLRMRTRNDPESFNEILTSGLDAPTVSPGDSITFTQSSLLVRLSKDFAITTDRDEPEFFQRSTVANAVKFYALKGSEKAYEIRGDVAGFDVRAIGLWCITGPLAFIPAGNLFEIPLGSGKYFTDIPPVDIRFDDIAGDVQFDDPGVGVIGIIDFSLIHNDGSPDGLSPGGAFAENILEGFFTGAPAEDSFVTVDVVTAMTQMELDALEVASGFRVEATMTQGQRDLVGTFTRGRFILEGIDSDLGAQYFIEQEVSFVPDTVTFFVTSLAPVVSNRYNIRYLPEQLISCDWCRSHTIVFELTPTQELIDSLNGDGDRLNAVADKLILKIRQITPIHVTIGLIVKNINIDVIGPLFDVTVDIVGEVVILAPFQAHYDDIPADDIFTDDIGPVVTVT